MTDAVPAKLQPGAIAAPATGAGFPTPSWSLMRSPDPDGAMQWTGVALPQAGTLWIHASGDTPTALYFMPHGDVPQPIAMNTDVSFQASIGDALVFAFPSGASPDFQLNWGFA